MRKELKIVLHLLGVNESIYSKRHDIEFIEEATETVRRDKAREIAQQHGKSTGVVSYFTVPDNDFERLKDMLDSFDATNALTPNLLRGAGFDTSLLTDEDLTSITKIVMMTRYSIENCIDDFINDPDAKGIDIILFSSIVDGVLLDTIKVSKSTGKLSAMGLVLHLLADIVNDALIKKFNSETQIVIQMCSQSVEILPNPNFVN